MVHNIEDPEKGKDDVSFMRIAKDLTQLVGNTPLLELGRFSAAAGAGRLLAKLEYMNPLSSAKDRVGLALINDAEARGALAPGGTVVEPTSGNTGVGLAGVCAIRGYRLILTMPENMSEERKRLLRALGAELHLTPAEGGMSAAIAEAERLAAAIPGAFLAGQFENPANPAAHEATTGPEIWRDTDGAVDALVAGVGTGGTLTGTARYLRSHKPELFVCGVEPADSPVLSGGKAGPHGLAGIGAGFVPKVLDRALLSEVRTVTTDQAYAAARLLARTEGVLCGITSGAALHAAAELSRTPAMQGKCIVVILPDTGERYLSTPLYAE